MHEQTSRFLSSFGKIEARLRELAGAVEHAEFATLLRQAAERDGLVRRFRKTLLDFARLRNVLVHDHDHRAELAIPSAAALARIDEALQLLTSPPRLESVCARPVATCRPTDPIGDAAGAMRSGSFSQLPVHDGQRIVGLLTSETIARWLAERLEGATDILEEEPVEKVLAHQEKSRNHRLLPRSATVLDGIEAFDRALHSGEPLDAILLTQNGRPTEGLVGIVTTTDLPKLLRTLGRG